MVEAVVVVPVAMLLVLVAVQMALWAHAAAVVQAAAAQGDQAARAYGSSIGSDLSAGVSSARAFLHNERSGVVVGPTVVASLLPADVAEIRVEGHAEPILPWLSLPVSATRVGPVQEFRQTG